MKRRILFLVLTITNSVIFAQVNTVYNPVTGRTWMDKNLGASQVAISFDDVNAFGDLYQWGRASDGHQLRNSTTTTVLSLNKGPSQVAHVETPLPRSPSSLGNPNILGTFPNVKITDFV